MLDIDSNQISVKEILITLKIYWLYLKKKFYLIFSFFLVGIFSGIIYGYVETVKYKASVSFYLENETSGGSSGTLNIASQFGFGISGESGNSLFSRDNLMDLVKTRLVVEKVLMSEMPEKKVSYVSYYISSNGLYKKSKTNERDSIYSIFLKGSNIDKETLNLNQRILLNKIYEDVKGRINIEKSKKSNILNVDFVDTDELFAKSFVERFVLVLSQFYIETKSFKAKKNVDILQYQYDSVRNELNSALSGVAALNDNTFNLNPALNRKKTPSISRQIDVQFNTSLLAQVASNLETAKMTLRNQTPLLQIVDKPILPLQKDRIGKFKSSLYGALIMTFLIVIYLIISKSIKDLFK